MTDEQARKYIEGDAQFDEEKYEREHLKMLLRSAKESFSTITPEYFGNLQRTVKHYIYVNFDWHDLQEWKDLYQFWFANLSQYDPATIKRVRI